MPTPNTLRLLRESWISRLNTFQAISALGITFEDSPAILTPDLSTGQRRGYVAIGEERDINGTVIEAQLITTVDGGALEAKAALDLVDDARVAILDAAEVSSQDGFGVTGIQFVGFSGSTPAVDGMGHRVYTARHFFFAVRYLNPLPAIFSS
jgi:hypothetical protein